MTADQGQLRQPPAVDATAAVQRQLLQAERRLLETRLRAARPTGETETLYRQLQDRYQEVEADLRQHARVLTGLGPRLPLAGQYGPVTPRPVAAPVFDPGSGVFGFGSSGTVQVAPAMLGTSVIPPPPCSGEIDPVSGTGPGQLAFDGSLATATGDTWPPTSAASGVWLQTWQYLVPFPPPPVLSVFSYSFLVHAVAMIDASLGPARQLLSFVSLGETNDLYTGDTVPVDIDAGWPLDADLTQSGPTYDGTVGVIEGQITVQRSFLVSAYQVPGVAIVIGAAAALGQDSAVNLSVPDWGIFGDSQIYLGTNTGIYTGQIAYSYEPHLVIA